jgi:3-hydroxypropionyl-CoA synthetase (ADP-forming)
MGLKCYKDFTELPSPADIAVFAVAPETTIASFRQFCEAGGKGAIVVSDGFAEIGRTDLEEELRAISERHGVVYIGPNCLGVFDNFSGLNTPPALRRLNTSTKPGLVGVVSQSGGLELLEMAAVTIWPSARGVLRNRQRHLHPRTLAHMGDDPASGHRRLRGRTRNGLQFMEVGRRWPRGNRSSS